MLFFFTSISSIVQYSAFHYCCARIHFLRCLKKEKGKFLFVVTVALLTVAYRFTQLQATKLAPVALVLAVKRTSILYATFFGEGRLR